MIKKDQSKINTSSTSHREFQRRKVKTETKDQETETKKEQKTI
jgi:hypothetical protein